MDFSFGAARHLYDNRLHPRAMLGEADLPALRERLGAGDGALVLDALRRLVEPGIREILACRGPDEVRDLIGSKARHQLVLTGVTVNIVDTALVGVLDGNERAVEAVRRLLTSIPAADTAGDRRAYRYGGVGYIALAYDLIHAHLPAPERRAFAAWAHARGVRETLAKLLPSYYHHPAMNIPLVGLLNQAMALLCIEGDEGVPDLADDWAHVLRMFEASLNTLVGPAGYPEEDMGYGTLMTARAGHVAELLRRAGRFDPYTECPRYARFGSAMLHVMQPWGGHLTTTGDHGDDFQMRAFILARQAQEARDPAVLWLCTHLRDRGDGVDIPLRPGEQVDATAFTALVADQFAAARPPAETGAPTAFMDPQRGMVSFRSGWDADATYVAFDGSQRSPAGQGHEHASCGHFMLSALGDYFAVGPGRYNMEQCNHNVVLIDGKSGRSTDGEWVAVRHAGRLIAYEPGPFVDAAAVDSSLQHDCFWARRTLGLVKGGGAPSYAWVVDDINKNNDWAGYVWQLHTSPENTIEIAGARASIAGWRAGSSLDVHLALPAPGEYPRPHEFLGFAADEVGPSSYKYVGDYRSEAGKRGTRLSDQVHYSLFLRPRLTAQYAGLNGRALALMLPRAKGAAPARVERLESLPSSFAVRVTFAEVEDILVFAFEHGLLEAADVRARGQWCVVRRERAGGRVLHAAVQGGGRLQVGGRHVELSREEPGLLRPPGGR